MDKHVCKICDQEIEANNHFWRTHQLREEQYYTQYFPKYSKHTGELIKFKSREFYLNSDFNDKIEMRNWFKANPQESKDYTIELLKKRKELGKIKYALSQVELRSLMLPSLKWFYDNFDSYNLLCESLGLLPKFSLEHSIIEYGNLKDEATIIVDTREQKPFKFGEIPTCVECLNYGDYSLNPNKFKINIERKSLLDFASTFGANYTRFCKEVQRAKTDKAYLVVLVESNLNSALHFNYVPQLKYVRANPEFIFHNVREIMQKYNNIQFLFCDGRKEAADFVVKLFSMKRHLKHYDLQYHMDLGLL